jgi:hypothetical protein
MGLSEAEVKALLSHLAENRDSWKHTAVQSEDAYDAAPCEKFLVAWKSAEARISTYQLVIDLIKHRIA